MNGLAIITAAVKRLNDYCEPKQRFPLPVTGESVIAGPGSPLDSLAVVNLIMEVEMILDETGHPANLTNSEVLMHLDTAGQLAAYLEAHCLNS